MAQATQEDVDVFGDALENFVVAVFNEQSVKRGLFVADLEKFQKDKKTAKTALIALLTGVDEA